MSHFDVEGEMVHGMSGGPCFDKDWNVVGVNSKGWDGQQLAHVALLWPAMKTEIDPFKTGNFPAFDLFKEGPAKAIGYRRLQITSKGEARFAKVDPDSLVAIEYRGMTEQLHSSLNFAAANAQSILIELRSTFDAVYNGNQTADANQILRQVRYFFWELESVLNFALLIASRQMNLDLPEPPSWEQLNAAWRNTALRAEAIDELCALEFTWNGVELFELRKYAEMCRSGVLAIQCLQSVPSGKTNWCSLAPTVRKGGLPLSLPGGLEPFLTVARRFVRRLLYFSRQ